MDRSNVPIGRLALAAVRYALGVLVHLFSHLTPRDERLWVFTAGNGDRFTGNAKYLYLYAQSVERADVRPVWISGDRAVVTELRNAGYETYHADSSYGRYVLLRAGRVFRTGAAAFWPYTGGAEYVQLWHGNPLKRTGYDKDRDLLAVDRAFLKYISFDWDRFLVTGGGTPLRTYTDAFRTPTDRMLVAGYPRTDVFFERVPGATIGLDESLYERIEELRRDHDVVAYMPTWRRIARERDGRSIDSSRLDFGRVNDLMEEADAYFLVKYHPFSAMSVDTNDSERVITLPPSFDVSAILRYVDVLVTDYSSVYFDFLLLDRPVVFYPFDLAEYREGRGFYYDYEAVTPGPKATSPEELYDRIADVLRGTDEHGSERERVRDRFYDYRDGEASRRVYETIAESGSREL